MKESLACATMSLGQAQQADPIPRSVRCYELCAWGGENHKFLRSAVNPSYRLDRVPASRSARKIARVEDAENLVRSSSFGSIFDNFQPCASASEDLAGGCDADTRKKQGEERLAARSGL